MFHFIQNKIFQIKIKILNKKIFEMKNIEEIVTLIDSKSFIFSAPVHI